MTNDLGQFKEELRAEARAERDRLREGICQDLAASEELLKSYFGKTLEKESGRLKSELIIRSDADREEARQEITSRIEQLGMLQATLEKQTDGIKSLRAEVGQLGTRQSSLEEEIQGTKSRLLRSMLLSSRRPNTEGI